MRRYCLPLFMILVWLPGVAKAQGETIPIIDVHTHVEAYKRAIPKEHWKAVFHDNAVRVFKIQDRR